MVVLRALVGRAHSIKRILPPAVVALAAAVSLLAAAATDGKGPLPVGAFTTRGAWSFYSAPGLHPPRLPTDAPIARSLAPGAFLLDNFPDASLLGPMIGEGGPLITDNRLRPIWFQPVGSAVVSSDLQQETYAGKPVLVWWRGTTTNTGTTEAGEVVVVDQHYRRVAALRAQAPWVISLHDAVISGSDIWVTVYRDVRDQNLVAYGGSRKGTVYDAGVQEYDLRTGRLLYTWDALNPGGTPNVRLSASEQPASGRTASGGAWDAYHVNTIEVLANNQILVSMRNTWAAYLIDTSTNRIVWTLGGKHSSFKFRPGAAFHWQHDVQLLPGNKLTVFNDNCCALLASGRLARADGQSEGMVLRLNLANRTVSLVAAYPHRPRLDVAFLGSMQLLPNGNALVGWGSLPFFTEYARSGKELLDVVWPGKDQSYRALYSSTWVGTPYYPPNGAVRKIHGRTVVYASWNGATDVSAWEVLAGPDAKHLAVAGVGSRNGFETALTLRAGNYRVFEVRALDARRQVLGTSPAF